MTEATFDCIATKGTMEDCASVAGVVYDEIEAIMMHQAARHEEARRNVVSIPHAWRHYRGIIQSRCTSTRSRACSGCL